MIVVIAVLVLLASYKLADMVRDRTEGGERTHPTKNSSHATPDLEESIDSDRQWGTLDDHQLTRLLIQARRQDTTDPGGESKPN